MRPSIVFSLLSLTVGYVVAAPASAAVDECSQVGDLEQVINLGVNPAGCRWATCTLDPVKNFKYWSTNIDCTGRGGCADTPNTCWH